MSASTLGESRPPAAEVSSGVCPADERIEVLEVKQREFPADWHFHRGYELHLVLRGEGQRVVGDHLESFGPGDLVLIGPALPHLWRSRQRSVGDSVTGAHSLAIQFSDDFAGCSFLDLREVAEVKALLAAAARGIHFSGPSVEQVSGLMRQMTTDSGLLRLIGLLKIMWRLTKCAETRALSSPGFEAVREGRVSKRLDRIYRYIADHVGEPCDHATLAKQLRMSPSGLSHFFKRTTGRTLTTAVAEYRIRKACHLLATTDQTIAEIVYACGFQSISPFQTWFHRLIRMRPQEYRRQHSLRNGTGAGLALQADLDFLPEDRPDDLWEPPAARRA
jgi:AraC-like DNA-binding protein